MKGDKNYYRGGIAEIVDKPSTLTYSFMSHWMRSTTCFGKALDLLGLKYTKVDMPLVRLYKDNLVVDLDAEESMMYAHTVFSYERQRRISDTPKLKISGKKFFNPIKAKNTLKLLSWQTKLNLNADKQVQFVESLIANIPKIDKRKNYSLEELDATLTDNIWPKIIAIGYLSEFYTQTALKTTKENPDNIIKQISKASSEKDWFVQSVKDQESVRAGVMTIGDYIEKYQFRSDDDYELAEPRWHEIRNEIRDRIRKIKPTTVASQSSDVELTPAISTAVSMQIARSEVKEVSLPWIDLLRKTIMSQVGSSKIDKLTRDELLAGANKPKFSRPKKKEVSRKVSVLKQGRGKVVSRGDAEGAAVIIEATNQDIPDGTIGIFPTAGVKFATLYPKCSGMLFLAGGQTSHGAIVAREYGIPAIVDQSAQFIDAGSTIHIDGDSGRWETVG